MLILFHGWPTILANFSPYRVACLIVGLFSAQAAYGKRNKVPQENIPTVTAEKVKAEMLEGVETALGISKGLLPRPFYTRVQLWGAALPANTPEVPCFFDPHGWAGICGDWLLGSSVEAAVFSGISLAHHER